MFRLITKGVLFFPCLLLSEKFRSFIRARDQMLIELLQIRINCFFRAGFLDYRNWPSEKKKKRNKTKQNKTIHQDLGIGGRREEEK